MNEECTTPTANTRAPALATGPIRCATWCTDGGGHHDVTYAEDQYCYSVATNVVGTLLEPWEMIDGEHMPAHVEILARKDVDRDPHVVFLNQNDQETRLTPGEARELAAYLTHFAWVAERDGRERNAFMIGADAGRSGLMGKVS